MTITDADFHMPYCAGGCPKCGHLSCVCAVNRNHKADCPFRRAVTVPIGIECEHGRDVCPVCDPCTCEART